MLSLTLTRLISVTGSTLHCSFVSLPSLCLLLSSRIVKSQGGTNMAKQLSERLAELSAHAKKAEDTVAAAQKETHDKIMSRWEPAPTLQRPPRL